MLALSGTALLAQNTDLTGIYFQKKSADFSQADVIHLSNTKITFKDENDSPTDCYIQWEFAQSKITLNSWCGDIGTSDGWASEYNWKYTGIDTILLTFPVTKQTRPNPKKKTYSIQHEAGGFTLTLIK